MQKGATSTSTICFSPGTTTLTASDVRETMGQATQDIKAICTAAPYLAPDFDVDSALTEPPLNPRNCMKGHAMSTNSRTPRRNGAPSTTDMEAIPTISYPPEPNGASDLLGSLSGLTEATRQRFAAWVAGQATDAEIQTLRSRQKLIEAQAALAKAQLEARRGVTEALILAEEEEAELRLRRSLRATPQDVAGAILTGELEIEKRLAERERLRQQRHAGGAILTASSSLGALPAAPLVEVDVSDEDIEARALQAVVRFGALNPAEAEAAWAEWRTQLLEQIPPYAAAEVASRAEEMRRLLR